MKPEALFLLYEKQVAEFKLELIRKLSGQAAAPEKSRQKRTSNMDMAEAVLKDAGKPLHVKEIIADIEEKFGIVLDRDSLSSAIIKQVRKEKRFVRVAPNTFDLRKT
jgi:DNA-directed RNA polymerase delta subunit